MVDGAVPELFVEDHGQGVQLTQFKHHAADGDGVRLHFIPLFLQRRQLGFGFFEAVAQFGVSGTVGFFGHGVGGVFCDAQAQHSGAGRWRHSDRKDTPQGLPSTVPSSGPRSDWVFRICVLP